MASMIGLLVWFLATLTLGGCAGMPLDYGNGASGYGYGGSCPQPYGAPTPVPMPMYPGYATAAPPVVYAPQPLYAPQPYVYAPTSPPAIVAAPLAPQGPHMAGPWIDRREHEQVMHSRQGRREGSLTPHEAQRLRAEQRHLRGAEPRMSAGGNLSSPERGRLNTMQNRANQDIYHARHNGVGQPGAAGPHPGNGHSGPMNSRGQPQINGAQTHRGLQPQSRPTQAGAAPSRSIAATPGQ